MINKGINAPAVTLVIIDKELFDFLKTAIICSCVSQVNPVPTITKANAGRKPLSQDPDFIEKESVPISISN